MKATEEQQKEMSFEDFCKSIGIDPANLPAHARDINSFEDACKHRGYGTDLPDVSKLPESLGRPLVFEYQITVILEAFHDGKKPDWGNKKENKYSPWALVIPDKEKVAGFGLSCDGCVRTDSYTGVGSRLCSAISWAISKYVFCKFTHLYEGYWL